MAGCLGLGISRQNKKHPPPPLPPPPGKTQRRKLNLFVFDRFPTQNCNDSFSAEQVAGRMEPPCILPETRSGPPQKRANRRRTGHWFTPKRVDFTQQLGLSFLRIPLCEGPQRKGHTPIMPKQLSRVETGCQNCLRLSAMEISLNQSKVYLKGRSIWYVR